MTDEHDDALEMMPAKPSEVSSRGRRKEVERGRAGGKTPEMRGKEGEGGEKEGTLRGSIHCLQEQHHKLYSTHSKFRGRL